MKILIIDNDISTTTTLKALLSINKNFEIEVAYDGREGLNKMLGSNDNYDLVLLDIMMPEISGYDVCEEMINNDKLKNIPVLLMSSALPLPAEDFYENLEKFSKFSPIIKGVLEKPFIIEDLISKIKNISGKF